MDEDEFLATLSDEQKTQYEAMKKNLQAQGKDPKKVLNQKPVNKQGGLKGIRIIRKTSTLDGSARQSLNRERQAVTDKQALEGDIKFNLGVNKYVKDYKNYLPEESEKLIELADKQKFTSETIKANTIRAGLINAFVEKKTFVDELPQVIKDKIALFSSLTEDEKVRRSKDFWEIVELGVHNQTQIKKASGKNKGFANDDTYASKWKDAGKIYSKKDK